MLINDVAMFDKFDAGDEVIEAIPPAGRTRPSKPKRSATKAPAAAEKVKAAPAMPSTPLPAAAATPSVDLADPADVAMLFARYKQLNESMTRMAEKSASDQVLWENERQQLLTALEEADDKFTDLSKDLEHANTLIAALREARKASAKMVLSVAGLAFAGTAVATIAFNLFRLNL